MLKVKKSNIMKEKSNGQKNEGEKMSNIADLIEQYILRRLSAEKNRRIELRRTDVADAISCAPSQISYVLNTRFTQDKGFVVESRRGLGGFIRIAQVPLQNLIYQEIIDKIDENTSLEEVQAMVHYLVQYQFIQNREAAILLQIITTAYEKLQVNDRARLLQSLFLTLANFS